MSVAIAIDDLHKRYGDTIAVDGISLEVREGDIFGILGRNGAGKTTTVETMAGLRVPDKGSIRVMSLDPRADRRALRQVLGVQLQECRVHASLRVHELLTLYRSFYARGADPDELLEVLGLQSSRDTAFENLSGGQQQRLSIALALVGRPRIAILDELTTGLDPEARREMWSLIERIRDDGVTVVLVSHTMEEVERLCDRVAIIDRGRIVAEGTPAQLIASSGIPQRVEFQTSAPFDPGVLEHLPQIHDIEVAGDEVTVLGEGELLQVVSEALVRGGVVATGTRSRAATLDDAFLELTGRQLEADTSTRGGPR